MAAKENVVLFFNALFEITQEPWQSHFYETKEKFLTSLHVAVRLCVSVDGDFYELCQQRILIKKF